MGFNWVPQWHNIGEKPTIILYTYITPFKYTKPEAPVTQNEDTTQLCYLGFAIGFKCW